MTRRRLFGLETEYAFSAFDSTGGALSREHFLGKFFHLVLKRVPHLPGMRCGGVFLETGARFYMDTGHHPEFASPECTTPDELVCAVRAGDRLLAETVAEMQAAVTSPAELALLTGNVDYASGATWGSHESYHHRADPTSLPRDLIPHFVSRVIYTGAGGFDNKHPGLRFLVSPRVPHLVCAVSNESTAHRSIYHTRDEKLAGDGNHRMHVICGESLRSDRALWLRVGTTALILALAEAGRAPGSKVRLKHPLKVMQAFAADPTCRVRSERRTAMQIQRHYLKCVEAELATDLLPEWATALCAEWRRVLDLTQKTPDALENVLDWRIKWALYKAHAARRGFDWEIVERWNELLQTQRWVQIEAQRPRRPARKHPEPFISAKEEAAADAALAGALEEEFTRRGLRQEDLDGFLKLRAELFELDTRFGQLGPRGTFASLDEAGVLDHRVPTISAAESLAALNTPPATTRAALRGHAIKELRQRNPGETAPTDLGGRNGSRGPRASWTGVWDLDDRRMIDLSNPFAQEAQWQPMPQPEPDPIQEAPATEQNQPRD